MWYTLAKSMCCVGWGAGAINVMCAPWTHVVMLGVDGNGRAGS
jgi:hypothetical protein